ncbi:unnamed protein product [Cylindrotheca closterium]|uniref:histidine kinase n=1 Tax=Cylindrotheca closterium TaxID=2856 RepID=A0AAD2FPJ3_9STRA|nr:unnamed protein product [Cylindrotheca closterium]
MQSAPSSSSSLPSAQASQALSPSVEPQLNGGASNSTKKHKREHSSTSSTLQKAGLSSKSATSTANEGDLQTFLDCSNMCIFGIDKDGKINLWNRQMSQVSGFGKDTVLKQPLASSTFFSSASEQQQEVSKVLDLALKGEATSNHKVKMNIIRNGESSIQEFLWNVSAQRSNSGSIVGAICMAQVVEPSEPLMNTQGDGAAGSQHNSNDHNKKDAIMTLQDSSSSSGSSSELQRQLDSSNLLIFGIGMDGKVNAWNKKMAEITEFSREEAMQQPFSQTFVLPKLRSKVDQILQRALEGKETTTYELEFRTKVKMEKMHTMTECNIKVMIVHGILTPASAFCFVQSQERKECHLLLSTTPRRANGDENGPVLGVMVFAQDVTEVTLHDRASMNRELRQLVETANAPIFGIDVDGNVNEWNDKTAEITGFSKAEALHQPLVSTFIVPNLRESVQDVLDAALQGNETSNYQLEFRTKTNETRYLLVNATTRRNIDSEIVGVVGVAQDVTDDRKHSEELREMQYIRASQEAKLETERNMTAYFAHELRNPLHAIDSALKLMPDMPLTAESTELVNSMTQCASFMSSIMNNLLDVRKMEEGKMVLNKMPLSLTGLMERVRTMLLPSVRSGVTFLTHYNLGDKDWVMGDSHRIQQVLTNVITNAIKYTPSGSIVVTVSAKDDLVRFECKDTGPGIPKHDQTKLFHRFVQRGGAPGTGLGLAIAKHLVDLTGGQIFFESDPASHPGTSCVIEMPLPSCSEPSNDDGAAESPFLEHPIRLLVVDDIRMNRTMFHRRVIKGIAPKAKITEACTGEEALDICKHQGFDVILMDQHMEQAGGVLLGTDTVVAMRRRGIDSVIVGCSGNDIDDQFMDSGTDWVMKKPTPPNDIIVKRLRQLLNRRQRLLERRIAGNASNSNNNGGSSLVNSYHSVAGVPAPTAAPYVTDFSTSEAVKRRLGLSVCPSFGPPPLHYKKKRKVV